MEFHWLLLSRKGLLFNDTQCKRFQLRIKKNCTQQISKIQPANKCSKFNITDSYKNIKKQCNLSGAQLDSQSYCVAGLLHHPGHCCKRFLQIFHSCFSFQHILFISVKHCKTGQSPELLLPRRGQRDDLVLPVSGFIPCQKLGCREKHVTEILQGRQTILLPHCTVFNSRYF